MSLYVEALLCVSVPFVAVDQVSESPVEELNDDDDDNDEKGVFHIVCVV